MKQTAVLKTISVLAAATFAAPAWALDGSAVVTGGGTVSFAGATSTNWVDNVYTMSRDLVIVYADPAAAGSFTLSAPTRARILAVGGGGGGGGVCSASAAMVSPYGGGGGGGAGGMVETNGVFGAGAYSVAVGAGGAGGASASAHSAGLYSGRSGGDTTLSTNGVAIVTAKGGGGGGGEAGGGDGGSGGGGSQYCASSTSGQTRVGGSGIVGQGHAGGTGDEGLYGGGGGGADSAGAPASTRNPVGGDGRPSDITGETVYYGGGGGGGFSDKSFTVSHAPVSGGRGGGGNGGYGLNVARTDATFYGGGGGGCGAVAARATTPGGSGYAGVVIVRVEEQVRLTVTIPARGTQVVSLPLVVQEDERLKFGDTEFASALAQGCGVLFWDGERQGWSGGVKGPAGWDPAEADRVPAAGEGFALVNASDEAIAVTVTGVSPSEAHLVRDYAGSNAWSLMAYPYPAAVKFGDTELANALPQGSAVKFWDAAAQAWTGPSKKTARGWPGAAANRVLGVGEAFFIQSPSEGTWEAVRP